MTIHKHTDGTIIEASETNQDNAEAYTIAGLNTIRSLIDRAGVWSAGNLDGWGDAYIDADGREDSVDTGNTTATFDTNKYNSKENYIIIEATSLTIGDFSINNCACELISAGKWVLYCTSGDAEVQRAQMIKTLFNGTAETVSGITGLTALKTSFARDVGKRGHYTAMTTYGQETTGTSYYTGTFVDGTQDNVSSWSDLNVYGTNNNSRWELPSGTPLHTLTTTGGGKSSDEMGTDIHGDEATDPATCQIELEDNLGTSGYGARCYSIVLCEGDITWVKSGASASESNIDFYTDHSIPDFTDGSGESISSIITHDIPAGTFSTTMSTAIGVPMIEDWETGADIDYKLTGTGGSEDTGWLDCSNSPEISSFTAFTDEPDTLIVRLTPKTTTPSTGFPSIKGFVVRGTD